MLIHKFGYQYSQNDPYSTPGSHPNSAFHGDYMWGQHKESVFMLFDLTKYFGKILLAWLLWQEMTI